MSLNLFLAAKKATAATTSKASFWLPPQASSVAGEVDSVFYFILILSTIFFVGIIAAMLVFMVQYRKRSDQDQTADISHNMPLEIVWTLIPTVLVFVIFFVAFRAWINMTVVPADALNVRVIASAYKWEFQYPRAGIGTDPTSPQSTLVVPVNKPVKLTMISKDYLHSFYVPAFRIKRDVIPGRYSVIWFKAVKPGTYQVLCTEYCGTGHSTMLSKVRVLSAKQYRKWVENGGDTVDPNAGPVARGQFHFKKRGCNGCHSIDGTTMTGPSLAGIYGTSVNYTLQGGAGVKVGKRDDNYLRESILNSTAKIVKGFQPLMPVYKGQIKENQVADLIAYIKSLKLKKK